MNDQQIQTEIVEPIEHVESGNMTQQQGVYATAQMKAYPANIKS